MRIRSVTIKGFRCFNEAGQTILLNDFTCMVGPNASGKTTSMLALTRLFGDAQSDRTIRQEDFYLAPGAEFNAVAERRLSIEVHIEIPDIDDAAIPEIFNQMIVRQPEGIPFCRMRLSAMWSADGTPFGDIQQKLEWITTPAEDDAAIEANLRPVRASERARVRIVYVSATRDPDAQIRTSSATVFGRILKAIDWGDHQNDIQERLDQLRDSISNLRGLQTVNTQVQSSWSNLYAGSVATNVAFQSEQTDASSLLGFLVPSFSPNEQGRPFPTSSLSDGLRSLFALSLPVGFYRIEEQIRQEAAAAGFHVDVVSTLPLLTIFAVEEPENHLSPHYLGKVLHELKDISGKRNAQVLLSSHSPAIMRRVEPDDVRYYLGGETRAFTQVRSLALPDIEADEAFKYVREAIRGYPELYFSRVVVLGEGASEEIILKRVFEASGAPLDSMFVSIVPLGGRHVNHFWRLLNGLDIPYVTLLDLDREKAGAGWGRLRYVRDQLLEYIPDNSPRLQTPLADGRSIHLKELLLGSDAPMSFEHLPGWIDYFRNTFDVFFASPLDIDFSMLKKFPDIYKAQAPQGGGPRIPAGEPARTTALRQRMHQVLSADMTGDLTNLGSSYDQALEMPLFAWYKYLFIDDSKPVSHMRAMVKISDEALMASLPSELVQLIARVSALATPSSDSEL